MSEQDQEPIHWQGDLNDDCRAEYCGMMAHAEHMDKGFWYCSVWILPNQYLFHSGDVGISLRSGEHARRLCEYLLRLFAGWQEDREAGT